MLQRTSALTLGLGLSLSAGCSPPDEKLVADPPESFRADAGCFVAEHKTYRVHVENKGQFAVSQRGSSCSFETVSIARDRALPSTAKEVGIASDGRVAIDRMSAVEHLESTEHGVEQSWRFDHRPEGRGALTVRVGASGQQYFGKTENGLHLVDSETGLGLRYGTAHWVDARGTKTALTPRWDRGEIVLRVPAEVVEASAYPAVLDPTIGPEFGTDNPVLGPALSGQYMPTVAFDGTNYLVVWESGDVFAARVDPNGTLLDESAIALTKDKWVYWPGGVHAVAYDGANYLVVYTQASQVNSDNDIYGTRISPSGVILDPGGFPISTSSGEQSGVAIGFDGNNYLTAWHRSYPDLGVYGSRVSPDGTVLDPQGIAISTEASAEPALAFDGTNYLVAWQDSRPGSSGADIYGARVSPAGEVLETSGFVIAAANGDQQTPAIAYDGTNFLVAWKDGRTTSSVDVYGARVTPAGIVLDPAGVPIATAANGYEPGPSVAHDGTHFRVAWLDASSKVLSARVTSAAAVLDPSGIAVSTTNGIAYAPSLACGGPSCFVARVLDPSGGYGGDIYGARIDASGVSLDPADILVSRVANGQRNPSAAFDGTNYLIVWQDTRNQSYGESRSDIFGVRVNPFGAALDPAGIAIATILGADPNPAVTFDGANYLVVWADPQIRAARVTPGGALLDPGGIVVSTDTDYGGNLAVAGSAAGSLVVWSQEVYGGRIAGARVDANGNVLDPGGILIRVAGDNSWVESPAVAFDGTNHLVVWNEVGDFFTAPDIHAARVSPAGVVLDPAGFAVTNDGFYKGSPAVASTGMNFLVVWQQSGLESEMRGALVASDASVLPSFVITSSNSDLPAVVGDTDNLNYLVAWQDFRDRRNDLYGSWVGMDGAVLDPDGLALSAGTTSESAPALAFGGKGRLLLAYQAFPVLGTTRVRGRFVDAGMLRGIQCLSDAQCASRRCVDGVCCTSACDAPCRTCQAVPGTCTNVTSGADPDTCTAPSACDAAGSCKLTNGQPCASGTTCSSGFCVDGVCCATACQGGCDVCDVVPGTGTCTTVAAGALGSNPSCAPYLCNGGASCPTSCASDSACISGYFCAAGGICLPQKGQGQACNLMTDCSQPGACAECVTGNCADGACCDLACSGPCDVCNAPAGTCKPLPPGSEGSPSCAPYLCTGNVGGCGAICTLDSQCAPSAYCRLADNTCQFDEPLGGSCQSGLQCQSGFCVDGVCCESACDNACEACSAATKESGNDDGICGFAKDGADPHDDCADDLPPSCQRDGQCDGQGACRNYPVGTACGETHCVGNVQTGFACAGPGACLPDQTFDCGSYPCVSDVCMTSCLTSADCTEQAYCDAGACKPKNPNGQKCQTMDSCASDHCVDGVCCNSGCEGQCEACDVVGGEGTCAPVSGSPHALREACAAGTPGDPCSQARCDGTVRESCAGYVGPSTSCREASCADGIETLAAGCDGQGHCTAPIIKVCEPYACGDSACKTSCSSNSDCTSGTTCEVDTDKCVAGATCDGNHTLTDPNGVTSDCSPFRCDAEDFCKTHCISTDDCAEPFLCDPDGRCIAQRTQEAPSEEGGCSCREAAPREPAPSNSAWVLLAAMALRARRIGSRRSPMRRARAHDVDTSSE